MKNDNLKIAVYICHCGGNISDVIDVKRVSQELATYPNVVIGKEYAFMCSSTGQDMVIEDIVKSGINRVVIAACSPALHEATFRGALKRAGINQYLYEHVNIREQASWVHKKDKEGATLKAIALVKAAVEKMARQDELNTIKVPTTQRVAIIGGGIAGMRAAISSAAAGLDVVLIEKQSHLGGKLKRSSAIYPTNETAASVVETLEGLIELNAKIKVFCNAKISSISGFAGNFQINFEFDEAKTEKVEAGVIIIATGFDHYKPYEGEYAYGLSNRVVTLPVFIDIMGTSAEKKLIYDGKTINRIVFVHCVGSRQIDGIDNAQDNGKVNDYCSRVCCSSALFTINKLKDKYPDVDVMDIYSDMRSYGMEHETYYENASKKDILFLRRPLEERPTITPLPDGTFSVKTVDVLTWNEELELIADMIVLVTGMIPNEITDLLEYMKIPRSSDGFIQEVHPKLRPVESANKGIYIAGTALGPMDIIETLQASNTASSKAVALLSQPEIHMDPFVAVVEEDKCSGCGLCPQECSYEGALCMRETDVNGNVKMVASVNQALCVGCGACVAVCPTRAINVAGWTLDQFDAMVEAIAKG